jgi:hypothetical protein
VRLPIPNRITFLFGIFFSNRLFDCSDAKDMADFLDARPLAKPTRNHYFLKPGIFPMATEPQSNALNETERWHAIAEALPQAVEVLAGALNDPRKAVRSQAVQALGSLARRIREVQLPIRKALKRVSLWEDLSTRQSAARIHLDPGYFFRILPGRFWPTSLRPAYRDGDRGHWRVAGYPAIGRRLLHHWPAQGAALCYCPQRGFCSAAAFPWAIEK